MDANALVTWVAHPAPWEIEADLIARLNPPLNLHGNRNHPFHSRLAALRSGAKIAAKSLPVLE
jgi:hypothetical protein